ETFRREIACNRRHSFASDSGPGSSPGTTSIQRHPASPGLDRSAALLAGRALGFGDAVEAALGALFGEAVGFAQELGEAVAGVGAVLFLGAVLAGGGARVAPRGAPPT